MLELNRYENSDLELEIKKVNLAEVAGRVIGQIGPIARKKGIKITSKLKKTVVYGTEDSLTELSKILIENAVKYSGKNKSVEVKTKNGGILEVKDFGIGIPEADIPHIFDRFYRGESSRSKEKVDGYGLGLSIAKSIVDKLGGKIKVDSKLGQGTTFSVQIPVT